MHQAHGRLLRNTELGVLHLGFVVIERVQNIVVGRDGDRTYPRSGCIVRAGALEVHNRSLHKILLIRVGKTTQPGEGAIVSRIESIRHKVESRRVDRRYHISNELSVLNTDRTDTEARDNRVIHGRAHLRDRVDIDLIITVTRDRRDPSAQKSAGGPAKSPTHRGKSALWDGTHNAIELRADVVKEGIISIAFDVSGGGARGV